MASTAVSTGRLSCPLSKGAFSVPRRPLHSSERRSTLNVTNLVLPVGGLGDASRTSSEVGPLLTRDTVAPLEKFPTRSRNFRNSYHFTRAGMVRLPDWPGNSWPQTVTASTL